MKYDLVLNGQKEFYPGLNRKTYNILLCDSKDKINIMIKFFKIFIEKQNKNPTIKHFIGCDFEFNRVQKLSKDIALFQINLEDDTNEGTIFIFYPPELNKEDCSTLIKLLTDPYIIKILHGGESLDIPYLFDQVLKTPTNINNFCKNLYDTKYLCEYAHIQQNEIKKCSIYFLLEEYKIITNQKIKDLEKIEVKMGPIYLIHINIHKMSTELFRYSLYDVLFLPELIKKFLNKGPLYTELIPEISRLVFQYKRIPDHDINSIKNIVSKFNVHFVIINNNAYLLNDIYNFYLLTLIEPKFNSIIKITYFKEFMEIILRYVIYRHIENNQDIFESKNKKASKIPNINMSKYNHLSLLINNIMKEIRGYY